MRTKLYDQIGHRLVYLEQAATEEFWDEQWDALAQQTFANPPRFRTFVKLTQKYLPFGAKILEGGCGLGVMVNVLDAAGFDAQGIDFAPRVVEQINRHWPHLKVSVGDVRTIAFEDGYFDGYWSIGVIEHFPHGYGDIAREMHRVLRPGGYLFLTFPSFNGLRKARASAGKFELMSGNPGDHLEFYQFALDPDQVKEDFASQGFELVDHLGIASLGGLAEESAFIRTVVKTINGIHPQLGAAASIAIDAVSGRYFGHSAILVLRKTSSFQSKIRSK